MALMLQKKGCGGVSTLAFWYFLVQQVPGDEIRCVLAQADVKNSETLSMILECFVLLSVIMFLLSITVSC